MGQATRRRGEAWLGRYGGGRGRKGRRSDAPWSGNDDRQHWKGAGQREAGENRSSDRPDSGHSADSYRGHPGQLVRRIFAKDRSAAEAFFAGQQAWIQGALREMGGEDAEGELLGRVRSSFVRMAVRGLDGGDQTEAQLRRTIRGICDIQCEGVRQEKRGFFTAYSEKDLDAAKEIFNGLYRVLRESMIRKIRRKKAHEGEEEILQRVFFALWKNLSEFRLQASYRAMVSWVHTVLANQTAQWWREQEKPGLGQGTTKRLTRPILPDDAAFDWDDPEVVNAWLAGAIAEAGRSIEDRYLAEAEEQEAEDVENGDGEDRRAENKDVDPNGGGEGGGEGGAQTDDPGSEMEADTGVDVDEANGLGHGSYAASIRAAEGWRRGVVELLEQPVEMTFTPLTSVVGKERVRRLVGAVEGLPTEQRQAFMGWLILGILHRCKGREVAHFLEMNPSSFRGWVRKARSVVAEALGGPLLFGAHNGGGNTPSAHRGEGAGELGLMVRR